MSHSNDSWSCGKKRQTAPKSPPVNHIKRMFGISPYAVVAIPLLLVGCSTATTDLSHYSVRQVSPLQQAGLMTVAENELRGLGYVVYQRDTTLGSLRARADVNVESASRRISRATRHSGGTRRHAVVRIESDDEQSAVYCKVLLQQRATGAYRMLQRDSTGQDTPNETPIDRDAATTEEQNTLWRTLRRDRRSERELLDAIDRASRL